MPALPAIDVDSPNLPAGQGLASAPCSRLPESPKDTLNELHLFAGGGGGILGGILLGHRPVCAVEINPYARKVLLQRQRDGLLPWFPIWDDVRTFDGRPWRGIADVVCGGFPCQDLSAIGKREGIEGDRSGLWKDMARIVGEVGPRYVFVENSPMLTVRGLGDVLGDLAEMGYDARWGVLGADDAGASHERKRVWILANSKSVQPWEPSEWERWKGAGRGGCNSGRHEETRRARERGWPDLAGVGRIADGVANRMDRLAALGNGQVPRVAAMAWRILNCENVQAHTRAVAQDSAETTDSLPKNEL